MKNIIDLLKFYEKIGGSVINSNAQISFKNSKIVHQGVSISYNKIFIIADYDQIIDNYKRNICNRACLFHYYLLQNEVSAEHYYYSNFDRLHDIEIEGKIVLQEYQEVIGQELEVEQKKTFHAKKTLPLWKTNALAAVRAKLSDLEDTYEKVVCIDPFKAQRLDALKFPVEINSHV